MNREKKKIFILSFSALYLAIQIYFIVHAHFVKDKRFGFWMFAESSVFKAELYRKLTSGELVKTNNGFWAVKSPSGEKLVYGWNQFVRDFRLFDLERERRAKSSMANTIKYLDAALDFVIERIPEDRETTQLVLKVQYRKAGMPWQQITLESEYRNLDSYN